MLFLPVYIKSGPRMFTLSLEGLLSLPTLPESAGPSAVLASSTESLTSDVRNHELTPTESYSCAKTSGEGSEPYQKLHESASNVAMCQPVDVPTVPVHCSQVSVTHQSPLSLLESALPRPLSRNPFLSRTYKTPSDLRILKDL